MRCFLLVVTVAFTGCSHLSPVNEPAAGESTNTDALIAYRCNSGNIVKASYRSGTMAAVQYEGGVREMAIAVSGSGARYVGSGLEWWTKGTGPGSSATLFRHEKDGTTGDIVESWYSAAYRRMRQCCRFCGNNGIPWRDRQPYNR